MAAEHFPPIEFQSGVNVPLVDTLGNAYNLKFRYWANGPGKIYILEGTQPLQVLRQWRPLRLLTDCSLTGCLAAAPSPGVHQHHGH